MRKPIIAGMLAAIMLAGTITTSAGADNCVTPPETTQTIQSTEVSKTTQASRSSKVTLSRLKNCTRVYPEYAKPCGEPYVAELTKDRTIKGKLELNDGETLYIPSGMTLTLNGEASLLGGTIFVENGGALVIKSRVTIYDSASLICDGKLTLGRQGVIVMYGGMLYASPKSSVKLNADARLYGSDDSTNALVGEVIKINGVSDDTRRTFMPSIVGAVRTTTELGGSVLTSETVTAEVALKALSAKWYTRSEVPAGGVSEMLTVLFENGSTMKFSFIGGRIISIKDTSVRNIWDYADDKLSSIDDITSSDDAASDVKFSAGKLDTAASESTNIVTAKLDSFDVKDDTVDYWFTVTSQLKGEADKKLCVKRDREWSDEYKQEFEKGSEYLLFLESVDYVYRDLYYTMTYSVSAQVNGDKITKFLYNGGKYSPAEEISTVKKVTARIKDNLDMDAGKPTGGDYLHTDDLDTIISKSPYIVKVKITDNIEKFRESSDVSIYTVELEKSYKLTPETPLKIILPSDSVKVGEEYVIMLFSYSGWAKKHYMESSKHSLYKPDDEALKTAMKKANYEL